MKLLPVFCAVLLLTVVPKGLSAEQPFEGCVAPNTIASLLTRIRERKWQGISVEWVRSNWPTELAGLEYTSESAGSVISRDRTIKGHCQCCTSFDYTVEGKKGEASNARLRGLTINYSAHTRVELVRLAKTFASSSGLKPAELNTVGTEADQSFQWEADENGVRSAYVLTVRLSREERLWELYFDIARHVVE